MGFLSDAAQLLADVQAETDGEGVKYFRPAGFGPRFLTAVIGGPGMVIDPSTNLPARTESDRTDFIIRFADYHDGLSEKYVPQKGDRIDRTVQGRQFRYMVYSDDLTPAFEFGDPDHHTYRIHARLVEVL